MDTPIQASHCFETFKQCIQDYHLEDSVTQKLPNPNKENTMDWFLYEKCKVDTFQWHYEDLIRMPDLPDADLVKLKRKIDASNQVRTDLVEQMDDWLVNHYKEVKLTSEARLNTESPAWVIDRMSILALKIYHMNEQVERKLNPEHTEQCKSKLNVLLEQESDLGQSFDELMEDISSGKKMVKVYRQMKMYNDESLNPQLYKDK